MLTTSPATKDQLKPANAAFSWLLHSGIQDQTPSPDKNGGVNAWFDVRTQSYPFLYSEITGYAVNAYLFAYTQTGESAYLTASKMAADWLIRQEFPENGLIRTRVNHDHFRVPYFDEWVFTFDQWIIAYSLACLAQACGEKTYLTHAVKMADFLLANTVRPNGLFFPVYHVGRKEPEATGDKWSRQSGGFHAKALMALDKIHELTGQSSYAEAARKLFSATLELQQPDGRFITQDNEGSTHLHPHLYTVEGLLQYGLFHGNGEALKAALRGVEWVLAGQRQDGVVFSFFKDQAFQPFTRADVLAQTLRTAVKLQQTGLLKGKDSELKKLRDKLLSFQVQQGSMRGAFFYGQEQDGSIHYHLNAWVTMFAAQALWLADQEADGANKVIPFFI